MQLTLTPDEPRARRRDPETSHAAASSAKELQQRHHRVVLANLAHYGPLGKTEIARLSGLDGVAVARRMSEMQRAGWVTLTGRNVQGAAGAGCKRTASNEKDAVWLGWECLPITGRWRCPQCRRELEAVNRPAAVGMRAGRVGR